MHSTRILDVFRRSIAIAIETGDKEKTLIINVYAPATVSENDKYWANFNRYISQCKSKCRGKISVIITGDLNATTLKWHNGNSKNFINKNSKHIINLMDQFQLNLPSQKPMSHTFCRNMQYGTSIVTYEATLDHFLISKNLVSKVIRSKVINQTIVK